MSGPSDPSAGSDATGSASNSSEKPAGNESRTDDSSVKFINSLSVSLSRHIVKNSQEYDSRVMAMEVDERPTEDYTDIGGLDK